MCHTVTEITQQHLLLTQKVSFYFDFIEKKKKKKKYFRAIL